MSTHHNLKQRLRSVQNIQHITQAMEIVAGVRFRKLIRKIEDFRLYAQKLAELVDRVKLNLDAKQHPLFQSRNTQRIGVIIVASDKGLCGSYNENLFREAEKFLKTLNSDQVELILFGHKAADYFKNKKWKIKERNLDFTRNLSESAIKEWSTEYSAAFEKQEFDELWIVFTHFKNILSREARIEKILPLANNQPQSELTSIDFIFEPDPEQIYQNLIPYFFYAKLQTLLFESYASELSSRMVAMKAATKNADEMIEKLTLIKNKNRQLSITTEILEITAGAEGLK